MKVYIAAPFSSMTEKTNDGRLYGELKNRTYIKFLEHIERVAKDCGHETYLPHRDLNKWGRVYIEPDETVKGCYVAVSSCDIFIAYPGKSRGVHVEMGWASSMKKRIILLMSPDDESTLITLGLNAVSTTESITFRDAEELETKLREVLNRARISMPDDD
jgi:hypothetical protein